MRTPRSGTANNTGEYEELRGEDIAALRLAVPQQARDSPRNKVWVRGIVRRVAPPDFAVQGVPVATSANTVFKGVDSAQFFTLAPGRVVKVKGTLVNNRIAAHEVEFEDFGDEGWPDLA